MHENISVNGSIARVTSEHSTFPSSSALYGKGVFTTVRIIQRDPLFWAMHWRRLSDNAAKLGVEVGDHDEQQTKRSLDALIGSNDVVNGRARVTFLDESASSIWPFETGRKTRLLITTADLQSQSESFMLTVSPYTVNSRSPLAGIKSCNYMEKILALDEARGRGFDEAVQLDERGNAASACMANIFWVKGGELFTSALGTGCIPGTTREFVMENLECTEAEIDIESLRNAEAVFLTSAGIGIRGVSEFDGRKLPESTHPILSLSR
jgi:branched-chain amino acid aminotransferase